MAPERPPTLVLASASPRRRELLRLLGLHCRVAPQEVAEEGHGQSEPILAALSVALTKARAAAARPGEVVLGADTMVVLDERVLGKPGSPAEAANMLGALRGRAHQVLTGVALLDGLGRSWCSVVATQVAMRHYTDAEIERYVARGEPFDKAGGYAVQDRAFRPVERLEGCYLNVVGLPVCAVAAGLEALGVASPTATHGPRVPPCGFCDAGAPLVQIG